MHLEAATKQTSEIMVILSGMRQMRAGRSPIDFEKWPMAETRPQLGYLAGKLAPKDLVSKDVVESMMEDLGSVGALFLFIFLFPPLSWPYISALQINYICNVHNIAGLGKFMLLISLNPLDPFPVSRFWKHSSCVYLCFMYWYLASCSFSISQIEGFLLLYYSMWAAFFMDANFYNNFTCYSPSTWRKDSSGSRGAFIYDSWHWQR